MKLNDILVLLCLSAFFLSGCIDSSQKTIRSYGPDYLRYSGDGSAFSVVFQTVIEELSYKKYNEDGTVSFPYFGAGNEVYRSDGEPFAATSFINSKDENGYEYSIKTIKLKDADAIVILETNNPNEHILCNAVYKTCRDHGIRVISDGKTK